MARQAWSRPALAPAARVAAPWAAASPDISVPGAAVGGGPTGRDMIPVRNLGQNPYFWYSATCFALAAQVNSPANRTPHESILAIVGTSKRWATPRSQYAGSTESGPKNATLPQRVAKLEPTSRPSALAASTDDGPARHR